MHTFQLMILFYCTFFVHAFQLMVVLCASFTTALIFVHIFYSIVVLLFFRCFFCAPISVFLFLRWLLFLCGCIRQLSFCAHLFAAAFVFVHPCHVLVLPVRNFCVGFCFCAGISGDCRFSAHLLLYHYYFLCTHFR